jgi:hypothetical protein
MSSSPRRRAAAALAAAALPALLWAAGPARADDNPGGPGNPTPIGPIPLATSPTVSGANPSGFCSGDGCTGLKPELTGCDRDARTIRTGAVVDPRTGRQVGTIELRGSGRCQTNWARVTSGVGVAELAATVTRSDGQAQGITFEGVSTWSPMVFVGRSTRAQATGWINKASGSVADGHPNPGDDFN